MPVMKKATQKPTPLYLKPSATCPFKYVQKTAPGEVPNCRVVENSCDWFWPNKVCLEITTSIEATPEHPVRLLCNYDALTRPSAPTRPSDTPGRQRKRRRVEQEQDAGEPVDETPVDDPTATAETQQNDEDYSDEKEADGSEGDGDEADNNKGDGDDDAAGVSVIERDARAAARKRTS